MNVTVNGEQRAFDEGATVAALVEALGLAEVPVVVQRNSDIVERSRYESTPLEEGDTLELIRFVGGG